MQHLITYKASPLHTGYQERQKEGNFPQRDFLTHWSQHRASAWKEWFCNRNIQSKPPQMPAISIYIIKKKEGAYGLDQERER